MTHWEKTYCLAKKNEQIYPRLWQKSHVYVISSLVKYISPDKKLICLETIIPENPMVNIPFKNY